MLSRAAEISFDSAVWSIRRTIAAQTKSGPSLHQWFIDRTEILVTGVVSWVIITPWLSDTRPTPTCVPGSLSRIKHVPHVSHHDDPDVNEFWEDGDVSCGPTHHTQPRTQTMWECVNIQIKLPCQLFCLSLHKAEPPKDIWNKKL